MKNEIKDIPLFLDKLVEEYTDILIEQTKLLITHEDNENFEACAAIKEYVDDLAHNVATTINEMVGVDYQISINKIKQTQKYIYNNLQLYKD